MGANIGYVALALARAGGLERRVVCFEPESANLLELRRNVERNDLRQIEIVEAAVGESSRTVAFRSGLNGTVALGGDVEVAMVSLDDFDDDLVDFIKIDVEGYEGEVLAGARRTIEKCNPVLVVEVHRSLAGGWAHRSLVEWLAERYSSLEAFEVRRPRGFGSKVLSRYFTGDKVVPADLEGLLRESESGTRAEVFWLVAGRRGE